MRNLLSAVSAFAVLGVGVAMAADSASVQITATQDNTCQINSSSSSLALSTVDTPVVGAFTYTCNFEGQPTVTFTSTNGGVYTAQNGGHTADYGIYLNDAAPSSAPSTWLQASAATGGVSFNNITTSTGSAQSPYFEVGLTQPLPVSGTYTDTLTIEIQP